MIASLTNLSKGHGHSAQLQAALLPARSTVAAFEVVVAKTAIKS